MSPDRHDALRRRLLAAGLGTAASASLGAFARSASAQGATYEHPFANGSRKLVAFPEKRPLIVLTSRPPQLETPFEVFNDGIIKAAKSGKLKELQMKWFGFPMDTPIDALPTPTM